MPRNLDSDSSIRLYPDSICLATKTRESCARFQYLADSVLAYRLLLRHTMNSAQTPDQMRAINSDHAAVRKAALQNLAGDGVIGVTIGRYNYHPIGDVKVGVARGQALLVKIARARH